MAEVFDVSTWLGTFPLEFNGEQISLPPGLKPALTIRALDGWWVRNGVVNYNLNVTTHGPIIAMWGPSYNPELGYQGWAAEVEPGQPAVRIQVRDREGDGIPDWDFRSLLPAFSGRAYYRTNYAERKCETDLEVDLGISPLWPYVAASGGYEQESGRLRPPIVVDWVRGQVIYFSEIVTVRNQNCSYSLYSITPVIPEQHNRPNFETPFAFYDLSGEGEGYPNLILRTELSRAGDRRDLRIDFQSIRYSWRNSVGDWRWDYKIEVLGHHSYTHETPIGDGLATVDAPSYEEFPHWVVSREWPLVTFVDSENRGNRSSEGIYEWSPRQVGEEFYLGRTDRVDTEAFAEISEGTRGEYRMERWLPPRLYISPIDNRLHLLGAEGGLWNLPGPAYLRLYNLDGDNYIDGWRREVQLDPETYLAIDPGGDATRLEEALYVFGNHLLYTAPGRVVIRRSNISPSLLETQPPTDAASWRTHRKAIASYTDERRDPGDLSGWLSSFPGPSFDITGAAFAHLRPLPDGFRLQLTLQPGYQVGRADIFSFTNLEPGEYVVTYDGTWHVQPLIPPVLAFSLHLLDPIESPSAYESTSLRVTAKNSGLTDVQDLTLVVEKGMVEEGVIELERRPLDLPSGIPVNLTLSVRPQDLQEGPLVARLEDWRGITVASTVETFPLPQLDAPDGAHVLNLTGDTVQHVIALAMLMGFVLLAATTTGLIARARARIPYDRT